MTTLQFPAPTDPKHGPDRHLTMPSIRVEDLWRREHGSDLPTDWRHGHRLFDPDETTVLDLITHQHAPAAPPRLYGLRARFERLAASVAARFRRADPPTVIIRAVPPETMSETTLTNTAPLLRVGDPRVVFAILRGRGLDERAITDHIPQNCEWCQTEAPAHRLAQPTSVSITGDREQTDCCVQPECFHAALRWIDGHDDSGDNDIVVEIARRPAVTLR